MKFEVELYKSDEGFAVCVPSLPGCWSQGATRNEAIENIRDAVREYLDTEAEPPQGAAGPVSSPPLIPNLCEGTEVREVEIAD